MEKRKKGNGGYFGCCVRERPANLVQVRCNLFLDIASFGGSITKVINEATEEYSKYCLLLFHPFQDVDRFWQAGNYSEEVIHSICTDLHATQSEQNFADKYERYGRYTHCFVDAVARSTFPKRTLELLQNFKDSTYNCIWHTRVGDELEHMTNSYDGSTNNTDNGKDVVGLEPDEPGGPVVELGNEMDNAMIDVICQD